MDLPFHGFNHRTASSAEDISYTLTGLIPGVRVSNPARGAQISASIAGGRLGEASFLSLEATGLALEISSPWACGLALCYGGALQFDGGLSSAQVIDRHEALIFGTAPIQFSGQQWSAVLFLFDLAVISRLSQGVLPASLLTGHDGLLVLGLRQDGLLALARRALLSLVDYIGLFGKEQVAVPTAFEVDGLLIKNLAWIATNAKASSAHIATDHVQAEKIPAVLCVIADEIMANCMAFQSLDQLSLRSGYSKRQLQYLFSLHYGNSPMQFIKRARLVAASERLRSPSSGDTIQAIGQAFGWSHVSSFSAEFKRHFGVSPSVILRKAKQQRLRQSP